MTWMQVAGVLAALSGLGGVAALLQVRQARRDGVAADERAARAERREDHRDTIGDRDALIDRLDRRLVAAEERLDRVEAELRSERAYNRILIDHIWRYSPPPPERPEGA